MFEKYKYILVFLSFFYLSKNASIAQSNTIDSLQTMLLDTTSDKQFDIYLKLAFEFQRNDLKKADSCLTKAEKLINFNDGSNKVFKYYAALAHNKLYKHEYTSSLEIANNALSLEVKGTNNDFIKLYSTMGTCYYYQSEFEKAIKTHLKALKICDDLNDQKNKANIYNNISVVYMSMNDWVNTEEYITKAHKLAEEYRNNYEGSRAKGNMAILFAMQGKFDLSEEWFIKDLEFDRKLGDSMSVSKNYNNLGRLYEMQLDFPKSLIYYKKGLKIAQGINDRASVALGYQNVAHIHGKLGNNGRANENFKKGLKMTRELGNRDILRDGLLNISEFYEELGNPKRALEYYQQYHLLNDSIINTKHLSAVSELEIKYQTKKKENEILVLSAQKLKDNVAMADQLTNIRRLTLGLFATVLLFGSLFIIIRQRSRNQKQNALIAVIADTQIEERKRIAQDLHDSVGGSLALTKNKLENLLITEKRESKEASELLKTLSNTSDQIRQISHNMMPGELVKFGLVSAVQTTLEQIKDKTLKAHLYTHDLDNRIDQTKEIHLFRIIQEVVHNVLKHAKASQLDIHLNKYAKKLNLLIEDNGIGFVSNNSRGIGIQNIKNRVAYLNGQLNIDSGKGKGTTFNISIPL